MRNLVAVKHELLLHHFHMHETILRASDRTYEPPRCSVRAGAFALSRLRRCSAPVTECRLSLRPCWLRDLSVVRLESTCCRAPDPESAWPCRGSKAPHYRLSGR